MGYLCTGDSESCRRWHDTLLAL